MGCVCVCGGGDGQWRMQGGRLGRAKCGLEAINFSMFQIKNRRISLAYALLGGLKQTSLSEVVYFTLYVKVCANY